jgi:hypothetical protein
LRGRSRGLILQFPNAFAGVLVAFQPGSFPTLSPPHPGSTVVEPVREAFAAEGVFMTEVVRKELDALDLLMQDHREMESLFRDFQYLQQNRQSTAGVIENACAELRILDTLQTEIFYSSVDEAADDDDDELGDLLAEAEEGHDTFLALIAKVQHTPTDRDQRDADFTVLAEHVKQHVLGDERDLFPLVKKLKRLDLASVTAAMKKRKAELIVEMGLS